MTAAPSLTAPTVTGTIVTGRGRRYCVVTAGGPGQPELVVETSRTLVCLRRVCIDAGKSSSCPHAEAARAYLDGHDERDTFQPTAIVGVAA